MAKIDVGQQEFSELMEEVLQRLARDPEAAHLWQWQPKPGCEDVPPGPGRRRHLATLLGMLGAAALPGVAAGCGSSTNKPADGGTKDVPKVGDGAGGDRAQSSDGPKSGDGPAKANQQQPKLDGPSSKADVLKPKLDGPSSKADVLKPKLDGPSSKADVLKPKLDLQVCADDPCSCGDDPCGCGDDPCSCGDDPCGCADDPC